MDLKIDICRQVEWDSTYLDHFPLTGEEKINIEASLRDNLNVNDDYSLFLYGQYHYEQEEYEKAYHYFEIMSNRGNSQSKYKAAVMKYDALGTPINQKLGFKEMLELTTSEDPGAIHLQPAANINVGRAYFYGAGVLRAEKMAEKHWKAAADFSDTTSGAVVQAQMTLGLFYSLADHKNLRESFKYHSMAAKQGALESIGALGVMYMYGMGVQKNDANAYKHIKLASEKGSVYAKGMLAQFYYSRKLFTKCVETAIGIVDLDDILNVSREIGCLEYFIKLGISTACFFYARCLTLGVGVKQDEVMAHVYYSRSFEKDKKICFDLHQQVLYGEY